MHGVRVRWQPGAVRPSRAGSDFALFFAPVLSSLRELSWLTDAEGFRFPFYEWPDADSEAVEARRAFVTERDGPVGNRYWAAGPGFVPDYAAWCNDDWNDLYGFATPLPDWRAWLRGRLDGTVEERAVHLAATAEVCFFAVDGCYWELFALDRSLVEAVREGVRDVPALTWEAAGLAESVGV